MRPADDDAPFSESMLEWLEEGDRMSDAHPSVGPRPSGPYATTEARGRRTRYLIGGAVVLAGVLVVTLRLIGGHKSAGDQGAKTMAAAVTAPAPAPQAPAPAAEPAPVAAAPTTPDPAVAAPSPEAPVPAPAAVAAAPAPVAAAPAPVAAATAPVAPTRAPVAAAPVAPPPAPVAAAPAAAAPIAAPASLAAALTAAAPKPAAPKPVAPRAVAPVPVVEPKAAAVVTPAPKALAMNVPVAKPVAPAPLAKVPALPPLAKMPAHAAVAAPDVAPRAVPAAYTAALTQCRAYMTAGKIKHAVESCRQATVADPRGAEALTLLAEAEFTRGHTGLALRLATDATNAAPGYADAYVIIGGIYQDKGKKAEARAAYEQYLALQPKGKHAADLRAILAGLR